MTRGVIKRTVFLVVLAGAAASVTLVVERRRPPSSPPSDPARPAIAPHHPTLYCDFYDFMRKSVVVSFDFDVDLADPKKPSFAERFVVEYEMTKTDFGTEERPKPAWSYAIDDGTPTITAQNGETRIILYGLKPSTPGVLWIEAGVRSNQYRNLEGKCRQAYFTS